MRAGKLDKRIKIQTLVSKTASAPEDAFGGKFDTFTDDDSESHSVYAYVEYGSGGERRVGVAQEQANLPVSVMVRYSSLTKNLDPNDHRLYFDGKAWDIESVAPSGGRPDMLIIIARARV